jgi:hypothetical protein
MARRCGAYLQPQRAIDGAFEFFGGTAYGLMQGGSVVADSDRLQTRDACFQHAAVVAVGRFLAQVVAEMHFDAIDLFAESLERILHDSLYVLIETGMTFDGFVGMDNDLHMLAPCC